MLCLFASLWSWKALVFSRENLDHGRTCSADLLVKGLIHRAWPSFPVSESSGLLLKAWSLYVLIILCLAVFFFFPFINLYIFLNKNYILEVCIMI